MMRKKTIVMRWLSLTESCLFTGNEEVVHLAGADNDGLNASVKPNHAFTMCGKTFDKALVKKESVWNVVLDSKVEINNNKDRKLKYAHITY